MPLLPPSSTLVIASHNPGKAAELQVLTAPYGVTVRSAAELDLPEPEETGVTFAENAALKAHAAAEASGLPALADDSGLEVDALNGAPGIYSARWGGPEKDFMLAMRKVEDAIRSAGAEPEGAAARFICALCLALPDGGARAFEGAVEGRLTFPPQGEHGFGYDPIFIPHGDTRTFAMMAADDKRAYSHRARAFAAFAEAAFQPSVPASS